MKAPARIEHAEERLDQPIADLAAYEASLGHLREINRWLGGMRDLRRTLRPLVRPGARIALVDVGCGAADVPFGLVRWAAARGASLSAFAVDRAEPAAGLARRRSRHAAGVHIICGDALALPLADHSVDVALMTLTLHHFDGAARASALRELARVARSLVVVNDLERAWPNYLGARLLAATIWRANPFTRHDGPLSVLRGFTAAELLAELERAGLAAAGVRRRFFYRLIGTGTPAAKAGAVRTP